jgi:hypothetical protein
MHIPKPIKIGGLFVGCLATAEQAGEYLRMPPQDLKVELVAKLVWLDGRDGFQLDYLSTDE